MPKKQASATDRYYALEEVATELQFALESAGESDDPEVTGCVQEALRITRKAMDELEPEMQKEVLHEKATFDGLCRRLL